MSNVPKKQPHEQADEILQEKVSSRAKRAAEHPEVLSVLDQLATELRVASNGSTLSTGSIDAQHASLRVLREDLYPRLCEQVLSALDKITFLEMLLCSPSYRLGHLLLSPLRWLRGVMPVRRLRRDGSRSLLTKKCDAVFGRGQETIESARPAQPTDGMLEKRSIDDLRHDAFGLLGPWSTALHRDGVRYGAGKDQLAFASDGAAHIAEMNEIVPFRGKRILEIGPLEAGNTKQMLNLGAKSVDAVESNSGAYLRCLIAKNELDLSGARFLYGDCREVLPLLGSYDACCASGVLYHMENPIDVIDLLVEKAPLIYVYTFVASYLYPADGTVDLRDRQGRVYRGRRFRYPDEQHLGGVNRGAVWLHDPDIFRAFVDRGYHILHLRREPDNLKGQAMMFVAERRS